MCATPNSCKCILFVWIRKPRRYQEMAPNQRRTACKHIAGRGLGKDLLSTHFQRMVSLLRTSKCDRRNYGDPLVEKNQYSHCLSCHNNKNIMFVGLLWCFLFRYTYIMIWMNILRHQKHDVLLVSLPRCEALKRTARSTHFQGMVYRIRAIIF